MIKNIFDDILESAKEYKDHKVCRTCLELKKPESFSKDKTKADGLGTQCKQCYNEYHAKNSKQINARRQELHVKHKDREAASYKEWVRSNPDKIKWKHLSRYGITLSQFNDLVDSQNGLCLICDNDLVIGRSTHVDHCHTTGKVRGILCQTCNTKLGWYEKHHHRIVKYLNRSK